MNAKENILLKHVNDDGSINWQRVAGENRQVHDHWVERIGNDVIWDFNRAEGDRIEVVGHTADVYRIEHVDTDGNGVLDATRLHVQSNQGNAGAHNKDQLGVITVFGDLVMESDVMVHAHAHYGVIETIDQLDDALSKKFGTPLDGSPAPTPGIDDGGLPDGAVTALNQEVSFSGEEDYLEIAHSSSLELV